MIIPLRRLIVGKPLESARAAHEKIPPILALPVFASDALSSVAYATGEIMAALLVAGPALLHLTIWISLAIVVLLAIVATSYRQTVLAYPGGGGAYIVARDNLGVVQAQVAGAALLVDYILTVAVSISSGVAAIESLLKTQYGFEVAVVPACLACVAIVTLVNLRGVKESAKAFALPTYAFITIVYILCAIGLYHFFHGTLGVAHAGNVFDAALPGREGHFDQPEALQGVGLFLILHAFASGCTALTGVEAISNGVTAFKQPAARNAAKTMTWMAAILGSMFLGLSFLAVHVNALPETVVPTALNNGGETVLSQVGRAVLGGGPVADFLYFWLQISTALILVLAANTSFADFPRLSALQAHDGFLPKQLTNVGDRLVFDRGILTLGMFACALIWKFHGDVHNLIPLYAVGVFLSFTLSQAGMVKRWFRLKSPGWHLKAAVNGLGAIVTSVVLLVFGVVKFAGGAWIVIVLIPTLVLIFFRIHAHYASVDREMAEILPDLDESAPPQHAVLVLVPGPTRGALQAVNYARSLAGDCRGIHIELHPESTPHLRDVWLSHCGSVPLVILEAPYRDVVSPLMAYLDEVQKETPRTQITVVIPEFVSTRWWQNLLHGHTGLVLKFAMLGRQNVVVTNVRYHLKDERVSLRDMFDVGDEYAGHM
ncbi:MAG TPA: APC family permease [Armatimonadota bacterium]|jgi:amino acid transporter